MHLTSTIVAVLLAASTTTTTAQCELNCITVVDPVCGSNNKTYSNACLLQVDACTTKENITIARPGAC
ncbi:hypothetical protein DYB36_012033, partial [Aphanomyces astaci]